MIKVAIESNPNLDEQAQQELTQFLESQGIAAEFVPQSQITKGFTWNLTVHFLEDKDNWQWAIDKFFEFYPRIRASVLAHERRAPSGINVLGPGGEDVTHVSFPTDDGEAFRSSREGYTAASEIAADALNQLAEDLRLTEEED